MPIEAPSPAKALLQKVALLVVALLPWTISMYLHYWLEVEEIWQVDMPFRAILSVVLLAAGLLLSLLTHTFLAKRFSRR
ncbi:MAG: hypothetical protein AAGI27_17420 [Pseudomonadota bacterium]